MAMSSQHDVPSAAPAAVIRLGLAGLGWGERVATAMRGLPGVSLAACFARTPAAREKFAAQFGVRACASWEEMIADNSLHGVILMTPNGTHRDLAVAAMRACKHVLVTKPIAPTLPEAAEMIRVARESGRLLAVGHQSRRHPALRALKRFLEAGEVGTPQRIEGNTSSPTGLDVREADWRAQAAECPGGPLTQLGIHYIDNFQHFLGPVRTVSARLTREGGGRVDPDTAVVDFGFEHGATGRLTSSYVTPRKRWIRVTGERGVLGFEADGGLVVESAREGEGRMLLEASGDPERILREMLANEVREFADCIRSGHAPETDGIVGARNLAVVLAAVESQRRSEPVAVAELLVAAGLHA
jgi:UDP-N-acetyl-2-amino-2-deoxyglucuronate dehydrogenase